VRIFTVELDLKVRRAHFQDGLSGRQITRDFGISLDSVAKMLACSEPPGHRRTAEINQPKLDPYSDQIDQRLAEDKVRPRKQSHGAHTNGRKIDAGRPHSGPLWSKRLFSVTCSGGLEGRALCSGNVGST
jgi:hypothetical protein